MVITLKWKK